MANSTVFKITENYSTREKDLDIHKFLSLLINNSRAFPAGKRHLFRKVTQKNKRNIIGTYFPFSLLSSIKLIEEHPQDFEDQLLKDITKLISSALQSNIPGLAQEIANAATRLLRSNAEKYVIETLVNDIERGILLAEDFTASAVALAQYAHADIIPEYSYNYLVGSLQSPKGTVEKLNLLSIIDRPSEPLISFLKDILANNIKSQDRLVADFNSPTLLVASKMLTRWGIGDPRAIDLLGEHLRRYPKPSISVIKSIEQGFEKGVIPHNQVQFIVEGLVRLEMMKENSEGVLNALSAAISSQQPDPEIARITSSVMIGIPKTERIIDYYISASLLGQIIAKGTTHEIVQQSLSSGIESADNEVIDIVLTVIKEIEEKLEGYISLRYVELLIQTIENRQLRNSPGKIIEKIVLSNRIDPNDISSLSPFWIAVGKELENPRKSYNSWGWNDTNLVDIGVNIHIHLVESGIWDLDTTPDLGAPVKEYINKKYYTRFWEILTPLIWEAKAQRFLKVEFSLAMSSKDETVRQNSLFSLAEALKNDKNPSYFYIIFEHYIKDPDEIVRRIAIRGLSHAIRRGLSADIALIFNCLNDSEGSVKEEASNAITMLAKNNVATYEISTFITNYLCNYENIDIDILLDLVISSSYVIESIHDPELYKRIVVIFDNFPTYVDKHSNVKQNFLRCFLFVFGSASKAGLLSQPVAEKFFVALQDLDSIGNDRAYDSLGLMFMAGFLNEPILNKLIREAEHYRYDRREKIVQTLLCAIEHPLGRSLVMPWVVENLGDWRVTKALLQIGVSPEATAVSDELINKTIQEALDDIEDVSKFLLVCNFANVQELPVSCIVSLLEAIERKVAPLRWDEYCPGLSRLIISPFSLDETKSSTLEFLLSALSRWPNEKELSDAIEDALLNAEICTKESFCLLKMCLQAKFDDDWREAASELGIFLTSGDVNSQLILNTFYRLIEDEKFSYPNLSENIARLLGFVPSRESYEKLTNLLQTSIDTKSSRQIEKAVMGACRSLVQLCETFPEITGNTAKVLIDLYNNTDLFQDNIFSASEIGHTVIRAMGSLYSNDERIQQLFSNTINSYLLQHDEKSEWRVRLMIESTRGISSQQLLDDLLKILISSSPRLCNAAWQNLYEVFSQQIGDDRILGKA